MEIIQKQLDALSSSELAQLEALIYRYYKSATTSFIADRLENDHGYDIVMLKKGDVIYGVNFYHLIKVAGRPKQRSQYVLHFGQAMKRSGYQGNVIWKLGTWYAKKKIGRCFLLENVTGIASFISPRAFEHFTHLFPRHHFELGTEEDKQVSDFVDAYFNHIRGMSIDYHHGFCFDSPDLEEEDITSDWDRIYRAKNEAFNRLFVKNGIIRMKNNRIFKMPRHITVCGIRRPRILRSRTGLLPSSELMVEASRNTLQNHFPIR